MPPRSAYVADVGAHIMSNPTHPTANTTLVHILFPFAHSDNNVVFAKQAYFYRPLVSARQLIRLVVGRFCCEYVCLAPDLRWTTL